MYVSQNINMNKKIFKNFFHKYVQIKELHEMIMFTINYICPPTLNFVT